MPTPHYASGSSRESFAHSGVAMTPSVTRWSRNALASSAIRCRFVNRFARPKVLSHVARQRFSPRDAPLSSIGSRRDQFSDVISTMRALRLPTHASPVTYLFRFRGPRVPGEPNHCIYPVPSWHALAFADGQPARHSQYWLFRGLLISHCYNLLLC